MLAAVIEALAAVDQEERETEVGTKVGKAGNCRCSFNYGVTPFASWEAVFRGEEVMGAVRKAADRKEEYVILGSSNGWLVFYGAITFPNLRCVGIDLLASQIDVSNRLKNKFGILNASFEVGDAASSRSFERTRIAMVSSLCWPHASRFDAFLLLLKQMPEGGLVVSYHRDEIQDVMTHDTDETTWRFSLVRVVDGLRFSWNDHDSDKLFLWRKAPVGQPMSQEDVAEAMQQRRKEAVDEDEEHRTLCLLFDA